jgi:hypothetical protein
MGERRPTGTTKRWRDWSLWFAVVSAASSTLAADRPHLLFTSDDVSALRAKVNNNSDAEDAYDAILQRWPGYQSAPNDSLVARMEGSNAMCEIGLMSHIQSSGSSYRTRGRSLVLHVARNRNVDTDEFRSALRLRTLAFGYDLVMEGAQSSQQSEIRAEIQSYLAFMPQNSVYTRYLYNPYTSNKAMMIGASMGLAVIAIYDDVPSSQRPALDSALQFADQLVAKCRNDILASDGVYREGVLYGAWTMRMAIPYFEARRRFDGVDLDTDARIQRMTDWLAYEVLPEGEGRENNRGANSWVVRSLGMHSTYLDWAQTRYGSRVARYVYRHTAGQYGHEGGEFADRTATVLWSQPLQNIDPGTVLPRAKLFPDRGLYFYRSAWKSGASGNEILFSLQAGRFYGGHAQEDQGQYTLYAYGDRFAVDNGAAYPTSIPKDTESHNLILIDGLGQHNAGSSIGTDARFTSTLLSPFCDYVHADVDSAYDTHSPLNNPSQPLPGTDWSWGYDGGNPVLCADRAVAVIKGAEAPTWFFLSDRIQKDGTPRTYDWLLHTDATNTVALGPDPVTIQGAQSRMLVWFAHPRPGALALSAAPWLHGGEDPPTLRVVARTYATEGRYAVGLVPLVAGAAAPAGSFAQHGRASLLRLAWSGGVEDVAVFNPTDSLRAVADVTTDGRMAVVRRSGGNVVRYLLAEGSALRHASSDLLLFGGEASGALSGSELHLSRDDIPFMAYGPQVTRVVGPAGDVPFTRQGVWIQGHIVSDAPPDLEPEPDANQPGAATTTAIPLGCVPDHGGVRASIYDVRGRLVRRLDLRSLDASGRALVWDRATQGGQRAAAGVYLVRVEACGGASTRRVVVVR